MKIIEKIYYDFWIGNWPPAFPPAPGQDKDWLINDIICFANKEKATMMGYVDEFYGLWLRFLLEHIWGHMNLPERSYELLLEPPNHTEKYRNYIDRFVHPGLEKKSSTTQVPKAFAITLFEFWGVLKPWKNLII